MAVGLRFDKGRAAVRQIIVVVALILGVPISAQADTFVSCWVATRTNAFGATEQVTVCRLVGGQTVEYPAGESPPGSLEPSVGNDANGQCWFLTSADTNWQILSSFSDGSAILGLYVNGVLLLDTDRIPRCTSEPETGEPPEELAWEAITEYIHDPPTPDLNPPVGRGLTGLETFVSVPVPGPWADTISIPLYTIDVEVWVNALSVDWGDGNATDYPPEAFADITGYPDGIARHVYEVKTCDPPASAPDCHPDHLAYPLTVSYVWGARWRVNGGEWTTVEVPPSSTTVDYPVTEAVSTLTDAG
jgi:hypothetical protein